MRLMEEYKIDGLPLLACDAGQELSWSDLDSSDSGRTEDGVMHRVVVRHDVGTWGFSFSILTAEEWAYLYGLLHGKATFAFTYPTPDGGSTVTTGYCSKKSISWQSKKTGLYHDLKFNVIEC